VQGKAHSPDWQAIETVLLDMDGTLLDLIRQPVLGGAPATALR
jgi:hypothetical protein